MASPQGFHENWLVLKDGRVDMVGLRADWGANFSWGGLICRCVIASEWNVEGGRLYVAGFLNFSFLVIEGMLD